MSVTPVPRQLPPQAPDAVAELCKLCGVDRPEEIGSNGPAVGARVSDANADQSALRLFEVVFGRDSLMVALLVADQFPALLEPTVQHLTRYQGREFVRQREEEPGRIAHEIRDPEDETARAITAGSGWEWPYYGAIDATPLFLLATAEAARRRPAFLTEPGVGAAAEAAAGWVCRRLDGDPSGLLSTLPAFPGSLENQVWKDSWDPYMHRDGSLANRAGPVASIEVQALAHDALLAAYELLGERDYLQQATRLAEAVERLFWLPDERMYALGVDHDPADDRPRQLRVRASNMGWLLRSRLLDQHPRTTERVSAIAAAILDPRLCCGRGIRTLASDEVRYRPRAYHNGNVWLFDSYLCADGLARHGHDDVAEQLRATTLDLCAQTRSFPEFVGGDEALAPIAGRIVDIEDEQLGRGNRIEQPPQEIHGTTVASAIASRYHGDRLA